MKIYVVTDRDNNIEDIFLSKKEAEDDIPQEVKRCYDVREYDIKEKDAPTVPQQPPGEICQCCGGNGFSNYNQCSTCNGTGKLSPVR